MSDGGGGDALTRLEADYGRVPVDSETFEVPPMAFKRLAAREENGALGGARAVPRRGGAVLLVRTIDDAGEWSVPGGERVAGESHEEAAVRAVGEETGLDVSVDTLLAVRRFTFVDAFEPGQSVVGHWAWFGATDDGGPAEPQHLGVLEAGWFTELPDGVDDAGRISAWVERARTTGD